MKTFRYSTLTDAHKCLKYYELKHLLGLNDGSNNSGDMAFGTCIHTGIQDLFEIGSGVDAFREAWAPQESMELEYSRYRHAELMTLGQSLIEIFRDEHMKHFVPSHLEKRLEIPLTAEFGFSGTVDFLGSFKGVTSVVDWKTASFPYDSYKLKHNEQTYGYAHMAKEQLGFAAEQVVYGVAVKDPKNPRWQFKKEPVTAAVIADKLANITAMCDRLHKGGPFIKNPMACVVGKRVCPFFSKCHGSQDGDSGKEGKEEA